MKKISVVNAEYIYVYRKIEIIYYFKVKQILNFMKIIHYYF